MKWRNILMVVLIVAVLFFAFYLIYEWTKERYHSLTRKLDELNQQISHDLEKLNLAKETKMQLEKKARRLFKVLIAMFFLIIGGINAVLVLRGFPVFDVLEATGIILCSLVTISSLIILRKIKVNTFIGMFFDKLQLWIYSRENFNPKAILLLELRIKRTKSELRQIEDEINRREESQGNPN